LKPNYAKRNMRLANNTAYRPEQFRLQDFFKIYAPNIHIQLEYVIHFNCEGRNITRIPDLVDLDNKIAYFLNGEIHSPKKDYYNKLEIESSTSWKVENIYKDDANWCWLWNDS